ncbi:MAG: sporulation protein YunB [Bacilli bacterium]|nr:sporulation protein YunB [Bacilli bacterium]
MKKIRLKKQRPHKKINFLVLVVVFIFVFIVLLLNYINNKVSPILLNFAEIETTKLANLIINRAINRQVANAINMEEMFVVIKNDDGEIQTIDFNPAIVNKILSTTTNTIQIYLKAIEQGNIDLIELPEEILIEYDKEKLKKGIIYEIPFGAATGNIFLSNLGPKIPVRMGLIGSVVSNINTKLNQYGINNVLVEVNIKIEVAEQVNLPFMSKRVNIRTDVPLALKVIQGKIPLYYQGTGIEKNSSILALPIE